MKVGMYFHLDILRRFNNCDFIIIDVAGGHLMSRLAVQKRELVIDVFHFGVSKYEELTKETEWNYR